MKASGKNLSTGPKRGMKKPKQLKGSTEKLKSPAVPQPIKGSPEWKKLYPHGKYEPSAKHHQNSTGSISKPPLDGQTCLNKSLGIENYPHRIAIEGDNLVVFRKTSEGILHGYVCPWNDVPSELQGVLRQAKLVHSKTGKIL